MPEPDHLFIHPAEVAYAGLGLDRAPYRRDDDAWVAAAASDRRALIWPLWRDECLIGGSPAAPLPLPGPVDGDRLAALVLLGMQDGVAQFALDLSDLTAEDALASVGADASAGVRSLFGDLPANQAAVLAHARGLLHWHRSQRFCGHCGSRTEPRHAGHMRVCTGDACGAELFPRIEPAVITLVETVGAPQRCLLARHLASKVGGYALLAGFVETGESLEDAVRREVFEEAGVTLDRVEYLGSQPWPFPAGIMIAFRAGAVDDSASPDGHETLELRWFTRPELRAYGEATGRLGRVDSIDRLMLTAWLAEDTGDAEDAA